MPMPKGFKHSEGTKRKISETINNKEHKYTMSPEMREIWLEKQRLTHLGKTASEETKAKMRAIRNTPEHKALQSRTHKGIIPSEETRKKLSEYHKSHPIAHWAGRTMSSETKLKMSNTHKGKKQTPEHIKKRLTDYWDNPEYASNRVHNIMSSQAISPNKPETVILGLLNEMYPDSWKFVGDGSFTVGGINPDFLNVNGQKKVIECFGEIWHEVDRVRKFHQTEQGRKELLAKYGFDTLIIWQKELENIELVKEKIKHFTEYSKNY